MKIIKGFSELLKKYDALPVTGWIFIDEDVDISSKEDLKKHNYYLPENGDEEFEMEDERSTFIEAPTFKDIVINKRTHNQKATGDEILDAVIYYLENDDFQD